MMYVNDSANTDRKDTLVIDNIEANSGTDLHNIIGVYQKGLAQLMDQGSLRSSIKQVNLGVDYSKVSLSALPDAQPVMSKNRSVYTDAKKQKVLLRL